jgi:membrane protease YdiL (CAAX protease family)
MTVLAVRRHEHEGQTVDIDAVLPNSLIFIIFVIGISGFIRFRGLHLRRTFGLDRLSPLATLGWAIGLILAAFPLAGAASAITAYFARGELDPQPLVDLFNKVARHHDYVAMGKILLSAVVIQPACEEFLFRGFFYGVWKHYLGPLGAGFLACLLFAGFHASLAAFGGLFVLAVCLNIAYERTGSLLVPTGMHALFNLTSLAVIYGQAQFAAGQ